MTRRSDPKSSKARTAGTPAGPHAAATQPNAAQSQAAATQPDAARPHAPGPRGVRAPRDRSGAAAAPLASVLVGALFAALSLVLAPPVTGPKDAAEFTVVLAVNGAAHPTGYPLYVMLGHWFVTALH